jgi:hypothetical protein
MIAYIRLTDGAEMIEVAPHQYVNRVALELLGYHIVPRRSEP